MIKRQTIDLIFQTASIEEVVGEYIQLKRKGANFWGNCPFHNEKTPSFSVSPSKGIYKCFGCGVSGNSVGFLMEHEQLSYIDALKYLAKKYNIEVEETEQTNEEKAASDKRESLLTVNSYAQKYFTNLLLNDQKGIAIGLSYFKERGFRQDIINKFQLGYCLDEWNVFTDNALSNGYKLEYLVETGLTVLKNDGKKYDKLKGRVIFPIHNLSGRIIGFGGRVLQKDPKIAKYLNSPESEIYHKSKVLYGLYFAKKSIVANDSCLLVEGYTDVISMHQSGIENVVASSGTSLTVEQIRLIRRYTLNVTIIFDNDSAGIKAAFRGIDMILEEGLNVRVLLFPDGEDPDSYSKKVNHIELENYIKEKTTDFISFKTNHLVKEAGKDPLKKAEIIRDSVESIAKIPDRIKRSVYIKECSQIMDIEEKTLLYELNKILRNKSSKSENTKDDFNEEIVQIEQKSESSSFQKHSPNQNNNINETEIIRLLLNYGNEEFIYQEKEIITEKIGLRIKEKEIIKNISDRVANFILYELDNYTFESKIYQKIYDIYKLGGEGNIPVIDVFIRHQDNEICKTAVDLISEKYQLSEEWESKHIYTTHEKNNLKKACFDAVYNIRLQQINKLISDNFEEIKQYEENGKEITDLLIKQKALNDLRIKISNLRGRTI